MIVKTFFLAQFEYWTIDKKKATMQMKQSKNGCSYDYNFFFSMMKSLLWNDASCQCDKCIDDLTSLDMTQ
jgi:hypothetical protein